MSVSSHAHVDEFMSAFYGPMRGLAAISHTKVGGGLDTIFFDCETELDHIAPYVAQVDGDEQPTSIYFRLETTKYRPEHGRGKARDSTFWRCLRADIDVASPAHKTDNVADDEESAMKIVANAGLPDPTYWIHSGNGLQAYWFFAPEEISERGYDWCKGLSKAWTERLQSAGKGVDDKHDLAALLRLPGTINRKLGGSALCQVIEGPGETFTVEELAEYVGYSGPQERTVTSERTGEVRTGSPFDVLAGFPWEWILEPAGWQLVGADDRQEKWLRPGDTTSAHSAIIYRDQPNVIVNYSDNSGLPKGEGQRLTKGRVAARLYYGGRNDHLAGDINAYIDGAENTRAAEIWAKFPDALAYLRENVTPMSAQSEIEQETERETEEPEKGRRIRAVFGDSRVQATFWLWEESSEVARFMGRGAQLLPRAEVALLTGREGTGKTTITSDIAARVSRGTLPGDLYGQPHKVLYIASEDHWNATLVPRLLAAGADIDNIGRIEVTADGHGGSLKFPHDIPAIAEICDEQAIALVVLDPLSALIDGGVDTMKDAEARKVLTPLTNLAHDTGATVLGIVHFNKGHGRDALSRVTGSTAFSAVARVVLACAVLPGDEDGQEPTRLFGQTKSNLGPRLSRSWKYDIETERVGQDQEKAIFGTRIAWGDTVSKDIATVIQEEGQQRRKADGSKVEQAKRYIGARLKDGPMCPSDLQSEANAAGITARTFQRACQELEGAGRVVAEKLPTDKRRKGLRWIPDEPKWDE